MDDPKRVEVLEPFGDLQQLATLIMECTAYLVRVNAYQLWSRGIGVRLEILRDVPPMTPVRVGRYAIRRRGDRGLVTM